MIIIAVLLIILIIIYIVSYNQLIEYIQKYKNEYYTRPRIFRSVRNLILLISIESIIIGILITQLIRII